MAEENEGLLAYFQRMMTKLLEVCSSETGFSDVQDDYLATMMVDSIERVFMHGRKQESNRSNSWEVLKMGVDLSTKLDLLLATHTRSLERRVGMSPLEKSTEFFQYAILHRLLSNFCQQLTQNADLIQKFYFPGYILSSSEHSSMFVLQLSTLESLNFNAVWGTQNSQGDAMDDLARPQVTSIVQGSAASLSSPGSGKLNPSSSHSKSIPATTRPPDSQETSKPSILFGATDAPLTFSLKPRNSHSNPFAQAFTPIQSSPSDPSLSASALSIRSSTSSLPLSFASTSSEISEPSSLASSGSLKVSSPLLSSPATSPTFQAVRTEKLPETAPKSDEVPFEARPPSAPIEPVIEAVVEAPSLTADSQGSTKKRAKKRTINL